MNKQRTLFWGFDPGKERKSFSSLRSVLQINFMVLLRQHLKTLRIIEDPIN